MRVAVAAAVAVAVAGFASACAADAASDDRVAVIGDSIAHQSRAEIEGAVPGIEIEAVTGRTFRSSLPHVGPASTLVVELGTNDVWTGTELDQIEADIDELLDDADAECVVVVTVNEHAEGARALDGSRFEASAAHAANALLRERADVVVDWSAAVGADPGLVDQGLVHPSPKGRGRLAKLIADGVADCGS